MASESDDVNSAFDLIAQTEERLSSAGFKEGFETGLKEGAEEGHHLGYHRGAEIGAELGFYAGVVETWLSLQPVCSALSDKTKQNLEKVLDLLQHFPKENVDTVDIVASLDAIRVSYKRACSLLKANIPYPEASKLSF